MTPKKPPTGEQMIKFGQCLVGMGYAKEMGQVRDLPAEAFATYLVHLGQQEIDDSALLAACYAANIILEEEE